MTEKILVLIAVGALACIPVAFGIRSFVEARSMAVLEVSEDSEQLHRAIEYAFYIVNRPARTNGLVIANTPATPADVQ